MDWDRDLPAQPDPPFRAGDPVPLFRARASNNPQFSFSSLGGHYVVLCVFGSLAPERTRGIVDRLLARCRPRFDDAFASFFGVSTDPEDETSGRARPQNPGIRFFWDFDGAVTRLYGGAAGAGAGFTLVIDPFLRVVANLPFEEPEAHAQAVEAVLAGLPPPERYAGDEVPAPVLVLPRVFEPAFCRTLIELYETHGGGASGFMREREGKTVAVLDRGFKRRSDFRFDQGAEFEPLRAAVRARVGRRILPAIRKAFNLPVTRIERYIVACYDAAEGGFFRAHRDNTTAGTVHRQFAVTLNLNAEDYDGGDLRFPEFGPHTYRAPTGGAVVFGCGLLHEATPVTRGRRYACLPFLYDDAAAAVRQKNRALISGEVVDLDAGKGAA